MPNLYPKATEIREALDRIFDDGIHCPMESDAYQAIEWLVDRVVERVTRTIRFWNSESGWFSFETDLHELQFRNVVKAYLRMYSIQPPR